MKLFERDEPEVSSAPEVQPAAEQPRKGAATMKTEDKPTQPAPVAKPAAREGLSVIGKTQFVKGEVEAAEDMLVEGRVEGAIKHTASQLTIGVSGEFRYLASASLESARPPKATTRPRPSRMGKMMRSRKRS